MKSAPNGAVNPPPNSTWKASPSSKLFSVAAVVALPQDHGFFLVPPSSDTKSWMGFWSPLDHLMGYQCISHHILGIMMINACISHENTGVNGSISLWIPMKHPPRNHGGCRGYSGCLILGGMGLVTRCPFDKEFITWTTVKMCVEAPEQLCFNCLHRVFTSKFSRFIPPDPYPKVTSWSVDAWVMNFHQNNSSVIPFHPGWLKRDCQLKKMDDDRPQVFKG